jgi:hypothetical protein
MRTVGSEAAPATASSSMPASAYYSDPALAGSSGGNGFMRFAPVLAVPAVAAAASYGATKLIDQINGPRQTAGQPQPTPPAGAGTGRPVIPSGYTVDDQPAYRLPDISGGSLEQPTRIASQQAVQQARALATPTPMMRPESSPSPKDSILSRIFSGQDYQSSGPTRGDNRLYQGEKDGRKVINWGDPESAADFFRASKAQQDWNAQSPDNPSIGAGMKRGGAANAKPDSVHKALEIIHHLLTRGH